MSLSNPPGSSLIHFTDASVSFLNQSFAIAPRPALFSISHYAGRKKADPESSKLARSQGKSLPGFRISRSRKRQQRDLLRSIVSATHASRAPTLWRADPSLSKSRIFEPLPMVAIERFIAEKRIRLLEGSCGLFLHPRVFPIPPQAPERTVRRKNVFSSVTVLR